jgi:glyoxylase-like metal-dependent hydrolase (beta-lactamase superfamily II)
MDRTTATTVTDLPTAFLEYAPSVGIDRSLSPADSLEVAGETVTVDAVAGHAAGGLLFEYREDGDRVALVGDNVLAEITPNPFLLPPDDRGNSRPRVLPAYNDSLDSLREEDYDRFLPGHRKPITNPQARIGEIRAAHEDRTERVSTFLDQPMTPVEIMHELFGDLPATEAFSGMSEAVGHLDVLERRGRVTATDRGGLLVYESV